MPPATVGPGVDAAGAGRWYDARLPGFGLYVSPDGRTRSYFVEYRPRGVGRAGGKKRLTFARHGGPRPDGSSWTADLARGEALRLLGAVKAGGDPLAERAAAKARAEAAAADSFGAARRRTRVTRLQLRTPPARPEIETATETVERRPLPAASE